MPEPELERFFESLAARPSQAEWARYWRDQCELLSVSFTLAEEVLEGAERFLRGESLSARLHRDAPAIAVAWAPADPVGLAVAIYAAVPALLVGEMHRHPAPLEHVAAGLHVRPGPVEETNGELFVDAGALRAGIMSRLGYDEAFAKSRAPRVPFRRTHMREILI